MNRSRRPADRSEPPPFLPAAGGSRLRPPSPSGSQSASGGFPGPDRRTPPTDRKRSGKHPCRGCPRFPDSVPDRLRRPVFVLPFGPTVTPMSKRTPKSTVRNAAERTAIGYVRVSTEGQATDGVSLDAQRNAITAYCQLNGLRLVAIEADEGISGSKTSNRPGLRRAVESACGSGAVLVAYSLSRIARNTIETLELADRLENAGADLASLSERIDTSGACGRMVFRMLAVLAEFERDQIAERTRLGLAEKRRRGEKTGGRVPFGYRAEDRGGTLVLVEDATEQATLAEARRLQAAGLSLRAIGAELTSRGMAPKAGGRWHAKTLRDAMARAI
jgi:site-specific DNA recombinase